jgi:spoIIIJ-associated protein
VSEQPPPTAEGVGETVGEAKWAAVRDLERRFPGLDKNRVAFQVISEGERGLMGVGREPARVIASLTGPLPAERSGPPPAAAPRSRERDRDRGRHQRQERRRPRPGPRREVSLGPEDDSPTAQAARETVLAICAGLGLDAGVHVRKAPDGVVATVQGDELGLLIGKHGHTIDAIEYLVNALVHRRLEDAEHVTVDAQDYRRRREAVLHDAAERAAQTAAASGSPVTMEPMSSAERKVVHLHLKDHDAVVTESEGREPQRCVVVLPRGLVSDPDDTAEHDPELDDGAASTVADSVADGDGGSDVEGDSERTDASAADAADADQA